MCSRADNDRLVCIRIQTQTSELSHMQGESEKES